MSNQPANTEEKTFHVKLCKSGIGYSERQKRTLVALGLRHLGQERDLADNPAVRGMVQKVIHLVEVTE